ncbi:raffinose/stachyose/melibiose transport system substrate-binding protein [Kribbella aluminosa]|uniref:Raffinose/stachyose/melibiose transport system substrate-binding protein n=1 Tax=Kribbella aluminosa TaxID=416017 RepID=A0ABS4UJ65_9ACTN|nr:extracellular solute-binding protein [Kribbella aluminosa]MBP2351596.1 raffinose/stachyose/melibiose transport system substrate-binding protein [Kribbella aluminosa]
MKSEGNVTLDVWADQGEVDLMKSLVPVYEKKFPNVTVKVQFKSFNDLTATVLNAMSSSSPPDVAQGNQGWQIDGSLVKNKLIRPLNDVASAYGYTQAVGAAISQVKWSPDGKVFGTGDIYGMAPDNQMVGIFYNREKLAQLHLTVPKTFAEFQHALAAAKTAGQTPIVLGNSDKGSAMQAFSIVQGAMTPAADTVAWITGEKGKTFDLPSNKAALELWSQWANNGYLSAGYNGMSPDDAAKKFANGEGLFYIGGNWAASAISDGKTFGFIAAPSGAGNTATSCGSFGLDWHVSSRTKHPYAAIAFVGLINSPGSSKYLAAARRVPITAEGVQVSDPLFSDLMAASKEQLSHNGALYYFGWATPTMPSTFTTDLQKVMGGQQTPVEMIKDVQGNWSQFQDSRK